jgi:hypothetical protein
MKSLSPFLLFGWLLLFALPEAQATYPLQLRGGLSSSLLSVKAGGHLTGIVGWYSPSDVPPDMQHVLELYLGMPYAGSKELITGQISDSRVQLALAPGIRFIWVGSRIQPFFAAHLGWFPVRDSVGPENPPANAQPAVTFNPTHLGLNLEGGVRVPVAQRVAVALGLALTGSKSLDDRIVASKNFSTAQILLSVIFDA